VDDSRHPYGAARVACQASNEAPVSTIKRDSTRAHFGPCDNFLYGFKGAPRRAGPDGLDVEHEKQARPAGGEMSGQSGPP
jgi:hypothetical protein